MMRNPLLATRLFNTPLLAHPGKAAAVAELFLGDGADLPMVVVRHQPRMGIDGDLIHGAFDQADREPFAVVDGVAVIKVEGSLVNNGGYLGAQSGVTSYQGVQAQVQRARTSARVRAVVLEIDSFGGEVQGVFETAAMVSELAAAKPTLAICAANACSAAYLVASQARRITAPQDGMVGSIGAVTMHVDQSRRLDREGLTVTFIHAGARKVEGNGAEPIPEQVRLAWQASLDAIRSRFADMVCRGRTGLTRDAVLATEAGCFDGPEALRLGLIDVVAEPSAAFAAFRAAVNGA